MPPLGTLPSAYVAERTRAWAVGVLGGPAHAAEALDGGASLVLAARDEAFARQVSRRARRRRPAGRRTRPTSSASSSRAAPRTPPRWPPPPPAPPARTPPGAAAGKVFAEIDAFARGYGSKPETFAGLAGTGDLVATVLAEGSRNRRAGELLAQGMPAEEIGAALGQTAEAVAAVPLLAARLKEAGVDAPVLNGLAGHHRGQRRAGALDGLADRARSSAEEGASRAKAAVVSVPHGHSPGQGQARRRLLRALQGAPEGRLLVLVLPRGQPSRRGGPDRADVPAGVPALRARPAGVARAARCGRG